MDESNKRRRTTSSNDNDDKHIADLPNGLLKGIASYLAKPSVALFAIAMDTQSTQTSNAIISSTNNWNVLDFGDIEKRLAAKLSDVDIDKVLRSIDAANNLKILKLAGCVNISGSGLNMLLSSVAIEQIDMSLVGKHEVPLIEPEPKLSQDLVVVPILDSILNNRGSILKQLQFPKKWRNTSTEMTQFFQRYHQYLTDQRYCCSKCNRTSMETGISTRWVDFEGDGDEWHGTQSYTCTKCLNHFCSNDDCKDEDGNLYLSWCKKCEKGYCRNCSDMNECVSCEVHICDECEEMKTCDGEECSDVVCKRCSEKKTCHICNLMRCSGSCVYSYQCKLDSCNKVICDDCVEDKGEGGRCRACSKAFCSTECRYYLACGGDVAKACSTCLMAAASDFHHKLQECKKEMRSEDTAR